MQTKSVFTRAMAAFMVVFALAVCGNSDNAHAATKAQSVGFLLSQVRNASGSLAGGKVYFYEAGTSTLKNVWLDRGKQTPAANPYTLDSNGTAAVFCDGIYRIVIKTSALVTVYDRDYISIKDASNLAYDVADYASLAAAVASIGSTPATLQFAADVTVSANLVIPSTLELMPLNGAKINHGAYTISYAGSTVRWPLAHLLNGTGAVTGLKESRPEWFGAAGTGAVNDAAALTACITSITSKGEIVLDPRRTYQINTTLVIGTKNIKVSGGGTINLGADVYAFSVAGGLLELDGINFTTDTSATGKVATALSNSTGLFRNVTVTGLNGGWHNYWNDTTWENNSISILPATAGGEYAIHCPGSRNKVLGNRITGGRHHVYVSGGGLDGLATEHNFVSGNTFIGSGAGSVAVYATAAQQPARFNQISNNTFVDCGGHPIEITTNAHDNILTGNIINGFTGGNGISLDGVALTAAGNRPYNNTISDNTITCKVVDDTTNRAIFVGNAFNNIIENNRLIQPSTTVAANVIGVQLDSQTTPVASGNTVKGNTFVNCRLNNGGMGSTLITGNVFNTSATQTPITIDASGSANVMEDNLLGTAQYTTFADGDATPSITKGAYFKTANTGATSITFFDGGFIGQKITVMVTDGNTTFVNDSILRLQGAANRLATANDIHIFIKATATEWWELSRSIN